MTSLTSDVLMNVFRGASVRQDHRSGEHRTARYGPRWVGAALVTLASGCGGGDAADECASATASERVVYGQDDRIELLAAPETLQTIATEALIALIPRARLRPLPSGQWRLEAEPLAREHQLCDGVRFSEQPSAAQCTGTLVTDRLVLTANHCVTNDDHCESLAFVFGYRLRSDGTLAAFAEDEVYSCGRIAATAFDREEGIDVAWIELDRPAHGRRPVQLIRDRPRLSPGTRLSAVGFGQGLPAKVDPDVRVLAVSPNYFTASTDAFVGSSGMPVFDASLRLVGFSNHGEEDYEWAGDCQVPRVLDVRCADCAFGGEQIAYVAPALAALDQSIDASGAGAGALSAVAGAGGQTHDDHAAQATPGSGGAMTHDPSSFSPGTAGSVPSHRAVRLSGGESCAIGPRPGCLREKSARLWLLVSILAWVRTRQRQDRGTHYEPKRRPTIGPTKNCGPLVIASGGIPKAPRSAVRVRAFTE